jgi:D-alanyl-D-alanine carboxypeptidase
MHSTNYDSPHGLMNKWNYSTAHDIAKLAYNLMKIDDLRTIVNTKTYECDVKT